MARCGGRNYMSYTSDLWRHATPPPPRETTPWKEHGTRQEVTSYPTLEATRDIPCEQTNMSKNTTLQQLRCRVVTSEISWLSNFYRSMLEFKE